MIDKDIQALQQEAMKRIADILSDVQSSLAEAEKTLMEKWFADPDPEPVFVFRAQDGLAMSAITAYYSACLIAGLKEHAGEVNKAMMDFRDWQRRNPDRMKMPDKEHVPLPRKITPRNRISAVHMGHMDGQPCTRECRFTQEYATPRPIRDNPQA